MVGWLLRATVGLMVLALLAYTIVAVPIGRRTLLEHGVRIAKTEPARELAEDVTAAASSALKRAKNALDD